MIAQQTCTTHPYDPSPRINPAELKIFNRRIVHKYIELLEQLFYLSPRALINVRADVTVRQSLSARPSAPRFLKPEPHRVRSAAQRSPYASLPVRKSDNTGSKLTPGPETTDGEYLG